jgi:von Willebrand factor type A domain
VTFSIVRRGFHAVAALAAGAAIVGGLTAATAAPATTAKHHKSAGPTLTVRVGGSRTAENGPPGPPAATGLKGVTFHVSPASAGHPDTCVSTAAGLCTFRVDANRTYTVTQAGTPAGWYDSPVLDAGNSPGAVPYPYDSLSVAVASASVTIPAAAANRVGTATARGGTWALSSADPPLPDGCGLRIALLFDLSGSITAGLLPKYKAAAISFVDALKGTPSTIAIYTFGSTAPSPGTGNGTLPPVPVETQAGVHELDAKINGLTVPAGNGTNWDAGLWQIVRTDSAFQYQSTIVLTDGNPTYYGPPDNLGGRGGSVRFAETENAIFAANALKRLDSAVIGVGIGSATQAMPYAYDVRAISGPDEGTQYFNTDFNRLHDVLEELALRNCAGLDLTKTASPSTYTHVGQQVTYHYTVTSTKYFTLHNVHVTDDRAGHVACVPSVLATDETAHCTAEYAVTREDLDRGHLTNTATAHGTTPNDQAVQSEPAQATVHATLGRAIHAVHAVRLPAISLLKSAYPVVYTGPDQVITYYYRATNMGNVALTDVSVADDRLGVITCPHATLVVGASMTCTATYRTTEPDVQAGHVTNTATVTGYPPSSPPVSGTGTATVTAHVVKPGLKVKKTASPTQFGAPGQRITDTYAVTNTGQVTLSGIRVTDNQITAPVSCPATALAPGKSMACHATYVTTKADVSRGGITNVSLVTARTPDGSKVTAKVTATVTLIEVPVTGLEVGDPRDDLGPDDLNRRHVPDVRHRTDCRVEPELGQRAQLINDPLDATGRVEHVVRRLVDRVVVAADRRAVLAQDVQLPGLVPPREQVARVGVLRHHAQRLLLPAAADHDRRVRPGQRLRRVQRPPQLVVLPLVRLLVIGPHLQADLHRLLEPLEPLADRGKREAEPARLLLVPAGTDAQPRPPAGQHVQRGDDLGEQPRLAVVHAGDHRQQRRPRRAGRQVSQRGVPLEHLLLGRPDHRDLEEVVHHRDVLEPRLVRGPRHRGQLPAKRLRPARRGEIRNLQPNLHVITSSSHPLTHRPPRLPAIPHYHFTLAAHRATPA